MIKDEKKRLVPWVDGKTEIFGVIAHPIDHVRAPMVFNPIFSERCLPKLMIPIDVMPENLEAVITGLKKQRNFRGLAVTIPHKVEMAKLCDQLGKVAELTGAVNAVRFNSDGTMFGDNFDGAGFVEGCRQNGIDVGGKRILVIGAGGAARAIVAVLCDENVDGVVIANRNFQKAEVLVSSLRERTGFQKLSAVDLSLSDVSSFDIIINCTSLGLNEADPLPLGLDKVSPSVVIADIIMVPSETKWLVEAESRGLRTHYGRHMLDFQIEFIGKFIGAF